MEPVIISRSAMSSTVTPLEAFSRRGSDDALMGDAAFGVAVQHREVPIKPCGDVIGVEDRDLGGAGQAFAPIIKM